MTEMSLPKSDATTVAQSIRRFWMVRDLPGGSSFGGGILPALGMLLLGAYSVGPFAHNEIEATVRREVGAALAANGQGWARVVVSGQEVLLSGTRPTAVAGEAALEAARAATCPDWWGRHTCAVSVTGVFTDPTAPAPAAAAVPAPAVPAPPAETAASADAACEKSMAEIVAKTKIEFEVSSAALSANSAPLLDSLAQAARSCSGVIRVEGHTDSLGSPERNQKLSEARAASVAAALVQRGVPASRVKPAGLGAGRPVADNNTAAGRSHNRRIEFYVGTGTTN